MSIHTLDLEIDETQLKKVALDLAATQKEFELAMRSTLNRMVKWLKTQSARGLSTYLGIAQSILRKRLKNFRIQSGQNSMHATLWFGLNPVSLARLKPKQTPSGVQAGSYSVAGAFIATGKGGNRHVFKRRSRARLPIDAQYADIHDPSLRFIEHQLLGASAFNAVFLTTFERELTWRTQSQR